MVLKCWCLLLLLLCLLPACPSVLAASLGGLLLVSLFACCFCCVYFDGHDERMYVSWCLLVPAVAPLLYCIATTGAAVYGVCTVCTVYSVCAVCAACAWSSSSYVVSSLLFLLQPWCRDRCIGLFCRCCFWWKMVSHPVLKHVNWPFTSLASVKPT